MQPLFDVLKARGAASRSAGNESATHTAARSAALSILSNNRPQSSLYRESYLGNDLTPVRAVSKSFFDLIRPIVEKHRNGIIEVIILELSRAMVDSGS